MARKPDSNGVIGTLRRLFRNEDDRSLLSKFADREPLKKHRVNPEGTQVFKRSDECDNLIKNLLALDAVFNSQDFVCDLANGSVPPKKLEQEIQNAKARLDKKISAYGYWANRLTSLEALLRERPSLEEQALEDCLQTDEGKQQGRDAPYALRAVRLLERVEEHGRLSTLSPAQLSEKAWALHRLGLYEQANQAACQAVEIDPQHAEAWMLLAIQCMDEKNTAQREAGRYQMEQENADAMSSHEQWAEEMQDMAESKIMSALERHRSVVFPALLYWPLDKENVHRRYRYRENHELVRNWCIDWLFALVQPEGTSASTGIDLQRNYAINGLAPEFEWQPTYHFYQKWGPRGTSAHGLSALEIEVAKKICAEWVGLVEKHEGFGFFQRSFLEPQGSFIRLKLLHLTFTLGVQGYELLHKQFIRELRYLRPQEMLAIVHQNALFRTFTTHCAADGSEQLGSHFDEIVELVRKERQAEFLLLKSNLLRRTYDHSFVRCHFDHCIRIAHEGQSLSEGTTYSRPYQTGLDHEQNSASLSLKHWKYLELRAAVEIAGASKTAQQSLLSVPNPTEYFHDDADYLILEEGDIEGAEFSWYSAPFGASILASGQWLQSLKRLLEQEAYLGPEKDRALQVIDQLSPLVEQPITRDNPEWWLRSFF